MGAVWVLDINILDERHLFEDIVLLLALTGSAVDDGEGERLPVLENQECRYDKQLVDFTGDIDKRGAGIGIAFEFDCEKKVGVIEGVIHAFIFVKGYRVLCLLLNFVSGELEEEVGGVPLMQQCFLWVDIVVGIEVFEELVDGVGCAVECSLAFVT